MRSLGFTPGGLRPVASARARISRGGLMLLWFGLVAGYHVQASPTILTAPQSQTNVTGGSVTFNVSVTNSVTFSSGFNYGDLDGWPHTNVFYTGRTAGTLNGSYLFGSLSDRLTVYYGSSLIYDTGYVGGANTRTFSVNYGPGTNTSLIMVINEGNYNNHGSLWEYHVSTPVPIYYQWLFNGTNLTGFTNAACTMTNITALNAGSYRVVVTDSSGSVTSAPASLMVVLISPTLSGVSGSSTNFSFSYPSVLGSTYVIEYKASLNDLTWMPVATNSGTGGSLNYSVGTTGLASRFFRVVAR